MKILKIVLAVLIIIILAVAAWLYYPQYEMHQLMNKHKVIAQETNKSNIKYVSYIEHLKTLNKSTIKITAIGDSVMVGLGGDPSTNGFLKPVKDNLEAKTHKQVILDDKGIVGLTSDRLLTNLNTQPALLDEIKTSDVVFVNIGGNDIVDVFEKSNVTSLVHSFTTLKNKFHHNLKEITEKIHTANPNATIVLLDLYNPVNPNSNLYSSANQLLPQWNVIFYQLADKDDHIAVIETTNAIKGGNEGYISSDGVHPTPKGYEAISKQVMDDLNSETMRESVFGMK